MKPLLIIAALLLSFNLSAERISLNQQWQPSDEPGEAMYYITQPATEQNGVWPLQLFYLSTDKPFFTGSLNGPDLAGHNIVGYFEFFYDTGQLSRKGNSDAAGNYHGAHLHYREDGTLKGEYLYKHGQLDGEQKTYHQNGKLHRHEHYVNGAELGVEESFYDNGKLASRKTYGVNGLEGLIESYYDNGQPEQKVNMVAGKRQGERLYWSKDGWLIYQQNYLDDKLHGEERNYQAEGVLSSVKNYQHGKQVGLQQHFSGPEILAEKQQFDNAGREIQSIKFDSSGNITTQTDTQYQDNDKVTTEQRFDAAGKLSYKYQHDTAKDFSLRESFNSAGELTEREESLKGQYQGLYISTGWNGSVQRAHYVDGKKHGVYREDTVDAEGGSNFISGQYRQGIKVGKWVTKTSTSTLTEQFDQQGQQDGKQTEVAADGTVILLQHFKNAKLHGEYLRLGYSRELQAKGRYVNGQREGAWQLQDEYSYGSVKLWHGSYKAGHEVGTWQAFSANGHLLAQMQYDNQGRLQGKSYSFKEDGSLLQIEEFVDNQQQGDSVRYYNGEPSLNVDDLLFGQ